jgi:hypothetical protein
VAELAPGIGPQYFDDNGDPLVGGKVHTFLAGTTIPAATYTDRDELTPRENPVELDDAGWALIWLSAAIRYKFVITDANDVPIRTIDQMSVQGSGGGGTGQAPWLEYAVTDGQSASELEGQNFDLEEYSSVLLDFEISRGSTVFANGRLAIQNVDGVARIAGGDFMAHEQHGVTFSLNQDGSEVTLLASLDSGAGNGTIKISRRLVPV